MRVASRAHWALQLRKERELLVSKHQEEANKWEAELKVGKKAMEGAVT